MTAKDSNWQEVSTQPPLVTVIMPIRNEATFIKRSLDSVLAQDYSPERMEIIIVDGVSEDGTREIIRQTLDRANVLTCQRVNVQLLDNPSRIVPAALNTGLQHAHGDVIIRVDGHCEISPDYVRRCVEVLQQTGADNVGGLQRAMGQGWVGQVIVLATGSPFGVGNARFRYSEKPGWVDTVYLGAYRRGLFDRVGGFDEELVRNQDDEFNYRLLKAGGKIWLDPSVRSVYYSRASLKSLWRQYFQYGFWKVRVMQKHPRQMRPRQFVPPIFVAALLGSALLAPFTRLRGLPLALVAGSYILADLAASVWTARKGGWQYLPLLPIVFATLHLSWGLGFLIGLVRFAGRWRRM